MSEVSVLAGLGVVCAFLGLWLIWPPVAIAAVGVGLFAVAVLIVVEKRRTAE